MFAETLDTFLKDFGVPVIFGDVSSVGILDMPDQLIGDGISISTEYTLTVFSDEFSAAKYGDEIEVDGEDYLVRQNRKIDDGKFAKLTLEKV